MLVPDCISNAITTHYIDRRRSTNRLISIAMPYYIGDRGCESFGGRDRGCEYRGYGGGGDVMGGAGRGIGSSEMIYYYRYKHAHKICMSIKPY